MKILYASNVCSNKEFKKIFDICRIKPLQSIQKFNKLLCDGFIANKVDISVITSAPINYKMCNKIFWNGKSDIENNITYNYCFMLNIPIIKFITLFFSSLYLSIIWCIKNLKEKDTVVIYDAYCPVIANVVAFVGYLFKIKVIALYTDVPKCMNQNLKSSNIVKNIFKSIFMLIDKLSNNIASGYIILTNQMNEVINKKNKPFLVIEGLVDKKIKVNNEKILKYEDFTIMYAGGLYEKYGVKMLIDAVEGLSNIKLNLYGEGELVKLLNTKYKNHTNIYYGGTLPNNEILIEEKKCTLLVNPRFTTEEYTKYSFPSKNMEYMASGTPLLTTKLPGMPEEYYDFVYFIESENLEGFKKSIKEISLIDRNTLKSKGNRAQMFVLKNKNNVAVVKKIISFIRRIK